MKFKHIFALSAAAAGLYAVLKKKTDAPEQKPAPAPAPAAPATLEDELSHRMKEFMDGDHFTLFVQPVIDLSTGKIRGGEVLSRLNHPERGLVFPDAFLPIINRLELQIPFDLYIFRKSCAWLHRTEGFESISVNFSRKTLSVPNIALQLSQIADRYHISRENVAIEITEWEKERDVDIFRANLRQLRQCGFLVFLDDFGSGVTSIADLNQSAMDIVKIDRSVLLAAETTEGRIVMESLTRMANELGVDVVCEGIETAEQEQLAKDCGCRYGQGFRYFRPVSTDDLLDMISRSSILGDEL